MIDKSDLVNIGTLARPHGVGGEVLLRLQPALTGYEPDPDYIFIDFMGGLIPLEVYSLRYKNEQELLLLLDTIDSEEKARRLQDSDVFIDPEQLGEAPDEGDFSLADLIGLSNTIAAMEALGARRERIAAVIGPTIAQASYEVGADFPDAFTEEDARFFAPGRDGRFQFDLPAYIAARLARAGVGRVEDLALDTYAEEARFYSYRRSTHRDEANYGRQISLIGMAS